MRTTIVKGALKFTIISVILASLAKIVTAGSITYNVCTNQCNATTVACFSATHFLSSAMAIAGCNLAHSLCMSNCEPSLYDAYTL